MKISLIKTVPTKNWRTTHGLHLIALFVLVLLPLYLFGSIAEDVMEKENIFFDKPFLWFVHAHATPTLDNLMFFLVEQDLAWFWYLLMPSSLLSFSGRNSVRKLFFGALP